MSELYADFLIIYQFITIILINYVLYKIPIDNI